MCVNVGCVCVFLFVVCISYVGELCDMCVCVWCWCRICVWYVFDMCGREKWWVGRYMCVVCDMCVPCIWHGWARYVMWDVCVCGYMICVWYMFDMFVTYMWNVCKYVYVVWYICHVINMYVRNVWCACVSCVFYKRVRDVWCVYVVCVVWYVCDIWYFWEWCRICICMCSLWTHLRQNSLLTLALFNNSWTKYSVSFFYVSWPAV